MISEADFSARVGFTRRLRLSQVCPYQLTSQLASGSLAACVYLRSPSGHWVPGVAALDPALPAARISTISDAEAALDSVELLGTSDPALRYRALWTSPALRIGPSRTSRARRHPKFRECAASTTASSTRTGYAARALSTSAIVIHHSVLRHRAPRRDELERPTSPHPRCWTSSPRWLAC